MNDFYIQLIKFLDSSKIFIFMILIKVIIYWINIIGERASANFHEKTNPPTHKKYTQKNPSLSLSGEFTSGNEHLCS